VSLLLLTLLWPLARDLTDWSRLADPLETIPESSPEVIEQLRALGYLEEPPADPGTVTGP
jgi:hypothetical protein